MKIRSRLLLSFLPAFLGGIVLIATLLCVSWRNEIETGFQSRLRSSLIIFTTLLKTNSVTEKETHQLWNSYEPYRIYRIDSNGMHTAIFAAGKISHPLPNITGQQPNTFYETKETDGRYLVFSYPLPASGSLIAIEVQASRIDQLFFEHVSFAIFGVVILLLITLGSLYFIAGKISAPLQLLNNSALAIAAGQYGESIQVKGPKELSELANTLNTMSECLLENFNRLKENSLLRERMYKEAECAHLLQHLMLQKNIDECPSDAIAIQSITFSSHSPRGLLIDFPASSQPGIIPIHLAEAKKDGFVGMYELLTHYKISKERSQKSFPFPSLRLALNRKEGIVTVSTVGCSYPYFWSQDKAELKEIKKQCPVQAGDYLFLMNRGFTSFFNGPIRISDLLNKVLKHFALDGIETTVAMLSKEIAFAAKRKELEEDLHLLVIQILKPSLTTR